MESYAVVLAGGGGTRFWPLSRQNTPKQVLHISESDIMINETIKRFKGVIPSENCFIVTNKTQERIIKEVLVKDVPHENMIVEPSARNTAPCILYAALVLQKKFGDGVMCVFPSDHHITDIERFRAVLGKAIEYAEQLDKLITIGIKPTFPSTGYGYISYVREPYREDIFQVLEFVEKPNLDNAITYVASGEYLWNSGIFIWKTSVIIECFKRYLPRLYEQAECMMQWFGTSRETEVLEEVYPNLQSISIDYGVMERSSDVLVLPGEFGWNDVGSWDALGSFLPPDGNGNIIRADFIGIDTKNCIIYGDGKLIATLGLEDMVVVNTSDALLVCPKSRSQDIKKLVDLLKLQNRVELL